jgi:hypothetical protein
VAVAGQVQASSPSLAFNSAFAFNPRSIGFRFLHLFIHFVAALVHFFPREFPFSLPFRKTTTSTPCKPIPYHYLCWLHANSITDKRARAVFADRANLLNEAFICCFHFLPVA